MKLTESFVYRSSSPDMKSAGVQIWRLCAQSPMPCIYHWIFCSVRQQSVAAFSKLWKQKLTSCARGRHNMPRPCNLTLNLLTLKVVSESRVTWASSVPILLFLGALTKRWRNRRNTRNVIRRLKRYPQCTNVSNTIYVLLQKLTVLSALKRVNCTAEDCKPTY